MTGNPATPADEADVSISFELTDVRRALDLGDYAGELQGKVELRITDRINGAAPERGGNARRHPLDVTVPCANTAGAHIGSTCSGNTSADAVLPGMVSESKRTIWQMGGLGVWTGVPTDRHPRRATRCS